MNLFGKEIQENDLLYSESMGYGVVMRAEQNSLQVKHSGQIWRYNHKKIRQGCKISDLAWRKKPDGNQIKDKEKADKTDLAIEAISQILKETYD